MTTTIPLLGSVPQEKQAAFLASLVQTTHNDGEVLFRAGDPGDDMLLILEGGVQVSGLSMGVDEVRLAEFGPGDVVGEMAVLSPAPRSAAASALGRTRVAHLSRDAMLERLVLQDPVAGTLLRSCIGQVSERLQRTRDKAVLLRDVLDGADPAAVHSRLARIIGGEHGPLADRLKDWLQEQ